MISDVRHALRSLAQAKALTVAAVVSVALGVGANTAIFSVVNAVLLRPISTPWMDRLVLVHDDPRALGLRTQNVSPAEADDIARRVDLFDASASYTPLTYNLTGPDQPRRVTAVGTMGDFFQVFGVRPHLGRFYGPADSRNGDHQQAVLGYALWRSLIGEDPGVVGRSVQLDGASYRVVGVLPPEFRYPQGAQLFTPFRYEERFDLTQERGTLIMTSVSRLRPGVTLERARLGMQEEARRWRERFGRDFHYGAMDHTLVTLPLADAMAGSLRVVTLVLLGAVWLVLMIACANVACVQFVRGSGRAKELAVRAAVGASPGQLARPLLVESAILAVLGGICGAGVGLLLMRLLALGAPAQSEALRGLRPDAFVLASTALAALLAGVLFGVAPAVRAARTQPVGALQESARGTSTGRGRNRLLQRIISAQVALTTVLLLGSGLLLRSLASVLDADPGFRADNVLTATVSLPETSYDEPLRVSMFFTEALDALGVLPGVRSVAVTDVPPLSGEGDSSPFRILGRAVQPESPGHANLHRVSEDYFLTMGIPLRSGRTFEPSDDEFAPRVVVIDEQLARQYFPGEDPVGRKLDQGREATIIGVVGSANQAQLGEPPKAATYYSYRQRSGLRTMTFMLKGGGDPTGLARVVRSTLSGVDPGVAVYDVQTMTQRMDTSLAPRRFTAGVLVGFAALSLVLTVLGIYGVLSYTTAQRGPELAIRMAIGARSADVIRMVVSSGIRIAGVGIVAGVLLFLGLGRVVASLLYAVSPRDPGTVLLGAALLAAVAAAASYFPARMAARADPAEALRAE